MDSLEISKRAMRDLAKIHPLIKIKFFEFVDLYREVGYEKAVSSRSYKDKGLIGKRKGQRSIRLNRSYRVIYTIHFEGFYHIKVEEVNKHGY